MTFKVGDRVIAQESTGDITKGKCYMVSNIPDPDHINFLDDRGDERYRDSIYYTLQVKTMDSLEKGDVIIENDGTDTCKVLEILGSLVALSENNRHEEFDDWFLLKSIKDNWKIKAAEEDIKELTLEEVAKLAGVDVEKLRIKD